MALDAIHLQRRGGRVSIMDLELALTDGLDAKERDLAQRYAGVHVHSVAPGPWDPCSLFPDGEAGSILVVDGLLARETVVGSAHALELLGAEDLVRPCVPDPPEDGAEELWRALHTSLVATLNEGFTNVATRIPGLSRALLDRALHCSRNQSRQLAITTMPRVEDRIIALFTLLASRWGLVVPGAVRIPVTLTHETLGVLVGARRPTVTLAVSALRERGVLQRTSDGGWEICQPAGEPVAA
jgi:hypothetical protein